MIKPRNGRHVVEVYDPREKTRKQWVGTFDKHGPCKDRGPACCAVHAERDAKEEVEASRGRVRSNDTVKGWNARWLDLNPRPKPKTEATYREQVRAFVAEHGDKRLRDVDVELALEWLRDHRWTHNGLRTMFSDARRAGLVDGNPFAGLQLKRSKGRKHLDVLSRDQALELADCALAAWPEHRYGDKGLRVWALIRFAAFVGMRPAEIYGLSWTDLDFREDEVNVRWQWVASAKVFDTPKNGEPRTIVLLPEAREALLALPRPVGPKVKRPDGTVVEPLVFRSGRGTPISPSTQHALFNPVRAAFGRPGMDFYELRHHCGSYLLNDLELPQQDVAHQLGHTDGGVLVMELYGHPSATLAMQRIKARMGGKPAPVAQISQAERRHAS